MVKAPIMSSVPLGTVSGTKTVHHYILTSPLREQIAAKAAAMRSTSNQSKFSVTQVFANGERMIRSRHPDRDAVIDTSYLRDRPDRQAYLTFPSNVVSPMAHLIPQATIEVAFTNNWQFTRAFATGTNAAGAGRSGVSLSLDLALTTAVPRTGERAHFENSSAFVDSRNEWWRDEGDSSLYTLGDNPGAVALNVPVNPTLIRLEGAPGASVHDLIFDHIQFSFTSWKYSNWQGKSNFYAFAQSASGVQGALDGNFVSHVAVTNCDFSHLGGNAITLGGLRSGSNGVAPGQPGTADGVAAFVGLANNKFFVPVHGLRGELRRG